GNNGGLISIAFGWSMAVFVAVFMVADISGAHLSPAVSIGLAAAGKFPWEQVPAYVLAQMLGAMLGATLVWLVYRPHLNASKEPAAQLACFCTAPSIRNAKENFLSEAVATFIFMLAVLKLTKPSASMGSFDALPVALLVLAIGLSLGGPTGYAINPARDLGPRIMHALLPIQGKRGSDWSYAWIPVAAPIAGALLAAWASLYL
ncbi:MAG: aquaporin family protein, partial [Sphingobacteriia bacterium]